MKTSLIFIFLLSLISVSNAQELYKVKINDILGNTIDFKEFQGKKILFVNTASKCGYTPQYEDLQTLYEKFKGKLIIIGMPCNDFGGQEPGSAENIKAFCTKNYGVTFLLTEKIGVKQPHELIQWLTQKAKNGVADTQIKWNFYKFLVNEKGQLIKSFPSSVNPLSEDITSLL